MRVPGPRGLGDWVKALSLLVGVLLSSGQCSEAPRWAHSSHDPEGRVGRLKLSKVRTGPGSCWRWRSRSDPVLRAHSPQSRPLGFSPPPPPPRLSTWSPSGQGRFRRECSHWQARAHPPPPSSPLPQTLDLSVPIFKETRSHSPTLGAGLPASRGQGHHNPLKTPSSRPGAPPTCS